MNGTVWSVGDSDIDPDNPFSENQCGNMFGLVGTLETKENEEQKGSGRI